MSAAHFVSISIVYLSRNQGLPKAVSEVDVCKLLSQISRHQQVSSDAPLVWKEDENLIGD